MSARPLTTDQDDYEDVEETRYEIKTEKSGVLNVFVQGNIAGITLTTPVFMTLHDLGSNHTEFHKLVEHPCMAKLKARSVWIHVEIPGQEFDAPDMPDSYTFPSMDDIAHDLVNVLNYFNIKYCVTLGEGAGANIIVRFAMSFPDRVLGNILIHCTCSVESVMKYFHDKTENSQERDKVIQDYIKKLHSRMNPKNLRLYVESYLARTELTSHLKEGMKVDTMLTSGSRTSHAHHMDQMQAAMEPKLTTRVKIDDCGDVLQDAPEHFAYNLLLFCQGLGLSVMEGMGSARFLRHHNGSVRGVAYSPTDRYLFCSGAYDGNVCLYHALRCELIKSFHVTTMGLARNINAVRFTNDGHRILAATTARRLSVLDVETGQQLMCYDNCAFNGRERAALATDPICPHLAVCSCVNGKGLTLFDLRMPLPLDFIFDLHPDVIRDITFLHNSWPFVKSHQSALLSLSCQGIVKATTLDGRFLHCFEVGHASNTVAPTPEEYGSALDDGFSSVMMVGGASISSYIPETGIQERQHSPDFSSQQIWKLRYSSNGSILYAAGDGGVIRRYRRYPNYHKCLGELFRHKGDVQDMDISPYDEFLVTASKDKTVGLICLGAPNHGWTQYCELS